MASPENFLALWNQAVDDGNWELAADLAEKHSSEPTNESVSSGAAQQRTIITSELYWFGRIASHHDHDHIGPRDIM